MLWLVFTVVSSLFFDNHMESHLWDGASISAPSSWWSMSEAERLRYSSGCGPDQSGVNLRWVNGIDLYPACQIHDYMYSIGGSEEDRMFADAIMRENMQSIIESYGRKNTQVTTWYYSITRSFGWLFFRYRTR